MPLSRILLLLALLAFWVLGEWAIWAFEEWLAARTSWRHVERATFYLAVGGVLGLTSYWAWPRPLFIDGPPSGLSLAVVPLATGLLMAALGRHRERSGRSRAGLLRFWMAFDFCAAYLACRIAGQVGWLS